MRRGITSGELDFIIDNPEVIPSAIVRPIRTEILPLKKKKKGMAQTD